MSDDLERRLAAAAARRVRPPDLDRLRNAIASRAASEGRLDVAYATLDSPLGPLTVIVTPRGLLRLAYPGEPLEAQLDEVAARVSPRILAAPERTDDVRRQLDEYFAGGRRAFEIPVDWRLSAGFGARVLQFTARIPFGSVVTYRDVATGAGSPNAYRAAGNALGQNPVPIVVPCHRVLHADGGIGGYTGGLERKRYLLDLEGAAARNESRVPGV